MGGTWVSAPLWAQGVCMKDIMSLPLWGEIDPNIYTEPTIVRFRTAPSNLKCIGPSRALYGICGPDDGEDIRRGWFRSEGMVWTWESRSGARHALKAMRLRREKRAKLLAKLAEESGSSTK